ncbi:MAG TPA: hypothetical protein VLT51_18155 [Anaerolineales bacterium]|nr:hypothetical protein [Anaerolineales bacterium]
MRDTGKTKRAIIGLFFDVSLSYVAYLIINWLLLLMGREPVEITFQRLLPLGILMGLSMGAVMMNPPFGD